MKKIIKNAKLLDGKKVNILIENDKIIEVSNRENNIENVIDANGLYVMSGLNNAYFDGNVKDVDRLLSQGVTSVFDFSNNDEVTLRLIQSGIKVFKAIGDFNGEGILTEGWIKSQMDKYKNMGAKDIILYIINPNLGEESNYEIVVNCAKKFGLIMATHVSETLKDVGEIDTQYGMSPVGLLESYGFLDNRNILIDCVYFDKEDTALIENYSNSIICTCPSVNLEKAQGIAPIFSFIKHNLNIVIGGVNSNQFKELSLLKHLQSGVLNDKDLVDNQQINKILNTPNSMFNNIGKLSVGEYADIVFLDDNDLLNLTPLNVKLVLINGEVKYKV